ncbi:hypothetical protein Tco_0940941 [Tanacetum coccineum]|uniref:Uncharacterized protein n=1 Tax=Tanacetum coccineum TaxID=301880 RepID=A0ABQ5DPG1_9ASTR
MSPGKIIHHGIYSLTETLRAPPKSLGKVARERIPGELSPTTYPERHVARDEFPQRQVARERREMSLGIVFKSGNDTGLTLIRLDFDMLAQMMREQIARLKAGVEWAAQEAARSQTPLKTFWLTSTDINHKQVVPYPIPLPRCTLPKRFPIVVARVLAAAHNLAKIIVATNKLRI